jgi:arylsulfatase
VVVIGLLAISVQAQEKKPNIVVIFGDDIGYWNVGAYTHGLMGSTPNIDSIARDGILFTDHYGQPSCTAGRAAFIMGQLPLLSELAQREKMDIGSKGHKWSN